MPVYGARGSPGGADNSCLEVERTDFTWMGCESRVVSVPALFGVRRADGLVFCADTMRTDRYRCTRPTRSHPPDNSRQHCHLSLNAAAVPLSCFDPQYLLEASAHLRALPADTEWVRWNGTSLSPIWSQLKATEL